MITDDPADTGGTPVNNLTELAKTAMTKRELAWQLLKQTRNPEYVASRYGYTASQMRAALERYDNEQSSENPGGDDDSNG